MSVMDYFFDAVLGLDRVRDNDGMQFADLESAMVEATKIAAEIIVEELRRGGRVGADWRIEVLDSDRTVIGSILFYEVIFEPAANAHAARMMKRHFLGHPDPWPAYQRSEAVIEESRAIAANVRRVFQEIRQRLDKVS